MEGYCVFWGEAHDNVYSALPLVAPMGEVLRRADSHLDFYAAAYYTSFSEAFRPGGHPSDQLAAQPVILEGWKDQGQLNREWAEVQQATAAAYRPGEFVTFPGYEWQGNGSSGDHNVFALSEGLRIFRVDTVSELYECLRGRQAIAIPHHTAYRPGCRGRDWRVFDEEISPFAEIYSIHGCSETDEEWIGLRRNSHMGPGMGGGTYQDALDRGYHLGAICSTDNWGQMPGHHGRGRMACLARELTRESLWEAFKARRVYGVTGDRIRLSFHVNNAFMGQIISGAGPRRIRVGVTGSAAIDRIELLRNGRVIATHCHQGTWDTPPGNGPCRFKLRVEAGWGPRSNELTVPGRKWDGELRVEGGRLLGFEPCWISPGQARPELDGGTARFAMLSTQETVKEPVQNANVFEFEADPDAKALVRMNGLEERGTVREFCRQSRVMWFREECMRMLHELCGIEPGAPERDDAYHATAYKVKIHRAVPEAGYTATWSLEDEEPIDAEVHYRVRVEQRNGQRAWSSPIWVRPI